MPGTEKQYAYNVALIATLSPQEFQNKAQKTVSALLSLGAKKQSEVPLYQ